MFVNLTRARRTFEQDDTDAPFLVNLAHVRTSQPNGGLWNSHCAL
jgi:hypothetical protein